MGGFLKVLGGIALAVIVLIIGSMIWAGVSLGPLIKEATAFTDEAVPAIAAKWDREELIKRASPELKANLTREDLDNVYTVFASFGPLVKYNGSTCMVSAMMTTQSGRTMTASCLATAKCQNADIQVRLALTKQHDAWAIGGIVIGRAASPAEPQPPATSLGLGTLAPANVPASASPAKPGPDPRAAPPKSN